MQKKRHGKSRQDVQQVFERRDVFHFRNAVPERIRDLREDVRTIPPEPQVMFFPRPRLKKAASPGTELPTSVFRDHSLGGSSTT
jgi:hypothetical protein